MSDVYSIFNLLIVSTGIFPVLQIIYGLLVISLVVFLSWMIHNKKSFEDKGCRVWCGVLMGFSSLFAIFFFIFNTLMVSATKKDELT